MEMECCKGNVGSWNLGTLGYVGHQRRVKKELEALNMNYICFIEVGLRRLEICRIAEGGLWMELQAEICSCNLLVYRYL